jgi:hypothetical protein
MKTGVLTSFIHVLFLCFSRRRFPIRRSNPTAASSVCSGEARGLLSVLWILEVTARRQSCRTDRCYYGSITKYIVMV